VSRRAGRYRSSHRAAKIQMDGLSVPEPIEQQSQGDL